MPTLSRLASSTAALPIRISSSSISLPVVATTSSIRAGWMRPSVTSFSRLIRAISRRTGSKQLTTTRPGVSSMMTSTPVAFSNERMFRPSRPMTRPFMSSLGMWTLLTVWSLVCSAAYRWIAWRMICRALSLASSWACSIVRRTISPASRLHSSSTRRRSSSLACSWVMLAIASSRSRCSTRAAVNWVSFAETACSRVATLASAVSRTRSLTERVSSLRVIVSSRLASRPSYSSSFRRPASWSRSICSRNFSWSWAAVSWISFALFSASWRHISRCWSACWRAWTSSCLPLATRKAYSPPAPSARPSRRLRKVQIDMMAAFRFGRAMPSRSPGRLGRTRAGRRTVRIDSNKIRQPP